VYFNKQTNKQNNNDANYAASIQYKVLFKYRSIIMAVCEKKRGRYKSWALTKGATMVGKTRRL